MALPDTVLVVHRNATVLDTLGGRTFSLDLPPDDVVGANIDNVLPAPLAGMMRRLIPRVLKTREPVTERIHDDALHVELRLSAHGRDRVLAVLRDIADRRDPQASVTGWHREDALTGLLARTVFIQGLDVAVNKAKLTEHPLTMLALSFGELESLAHAIERRDWLALQRAAAERLATCLTASEDVLKLADDPDQLMLTNLSDGKFAAILAMGARHGDLIRVAETITDAFKAPVLMEEQGYQLSCHFGAASFPQDGMTAQHLLRNALVALDESTQNDAGVVERYADTVRLRASRTVDLGDELKWAVENDQLTLQYQPVFNLAEATPVSLEAYVRWRHPLRGVLTPNQFLPVAETTGSIQQISDWVLRTACRDALLVNRAHDNSLAISINLSRHYFSRPDLVAHIGRLLDESGFDPRRLQLDVTERMLMRPDHAGPLLTELKRMGVGLQIDDFGSGYSSLKQLKKFPLDALKIDGDFIAGVGTSGDAEAVCRSVIDLAHAYGMRCIAEAVETTDQVRFLRAAGCDEVQGNLFGAALSLDEMLLFLEQFAHSRSFSASTDDTAVASV